MSDYTLADGSASISGELSLLAEKEYIMPLSKKDTTESLKTALYELLMRKEEVEQLQKDNERLREGIRKITKVNPPAFSNLSPIEVVAMSPHELIPHVKELLSNNSIGEDDEK